MIPGHGHAPGADDAPLDILFINLSNWPGNPVYPYAFVQVSALARRAGLSVRRWDGLGLARDQQLRCIAELVRRHSPRAVALTIRQADSTEADEYLGTKAEATQRWFPLEDIHAAIQQVRAVSDAKVVLGGFTFTANPVSAAEYLQPDFGVIGEPDDFIAQFERVMAGDTQDVANLLYRRDGAWQQNLRVAFGPLDDIEYTPEIVDEIVRFHGERPFREAQLAPVPGLNTANNTGRAVAVEIARGCPFSCVFCCEPLVKGRTVRLRSLDVIEAEIRNLLGLGIRYLWFVCSELNVSKAHVMALAERLIRLNEGLELPVYWRAYFLPVKFSKDELRILLRSGLMLEQNGPFADLSEETLKAMREPYRVRHTLAHVRDLIDLNEEPEFAHRRMTRWTLWSWLVNPYATRESVRLTLETWAELGLDRHYDLASGYPALRVYECLSGLPEDVPERTITLTGAAQDAPSVIHPSFYYSRDLMEHFGSIDALQGFLYYAQDTFLSKRYRSTRDWLGWSGRQNPDDLARMVRAGTGPLPEWVSHPDLGAHAPTAWQAEAGRLWQAAGGDWTRFRAALEAHDPAAANAIVAALLHQGFVQGFGQAMPLFEAFGLTDAQGGPLAAPFPALTALLRRFADEVALLGEARRFGAEAALLLRCYLHALDLRLQPELVFLAAPRPAQQAGLYPRQQTELRRTVS